MPASRGYSRGLCRGFAGLYSDMGYVGEPKRKWKLLFRVKALGFRFRVGGLGMRIEGYGISSLS